MKIVLKIIGIVFLALVLLATAFVVLDECYGTVSLDYKLSEDGSYYICTGIGSSDENFITIPSKYKGKPVKEIGDNAFASNVSLKSVTLSDNITTIGQSAFYNCTAIYQIDIEDSIEVIKAGAFEGCEALEYRNYNNGKYLGTVENPRIVLMGLEDLSVTTFTPAPSTRIIYSTAFEGCENLESFEITSNVVEVLAFGNDKLKSITVSDDNEIFSAVDGVLYNKEQTEIFYAPIGLEGAITIPNTITEIKDGSFEYCSNLKGVTLPSSVTTIEFEAFNYLEYVNITDLVAWCNMDFVENYNPLIYADLYLNGEKVTDLVIPSSIKVLKSNVFLACKSIQAVTFEENSQLEKIDSGAFDECENLTEITFPNSLTSIGESSFANCKKLSNIVLPSSVKNIDEGAFANCFNLASLTISNGVENIGSYAFAWSDRLQSVTIPASVTSIGEGAFHGCDILSKINVNEDNANYSSDSDGTLFNKEKTTLIKYCDGNGTGISYTVPNSVTSIDVLAFSNCDGLKRITIPVSVTSIGSSAFSYCTKLKDIYFTSGTKVQWNNISKGSSWDLEMAEAGILGYGYYTVHCKDVDIDNKTV